MQLGSREYARIEEKMGGPAEAAQAMAGLISYVGGSLASEEALAQAY